MLRQSNQLTRQKSTILSFGAVVVVTDAVDVADATAVAVVVDAVDVTAVADAIVVVDVSGGNANSTAILTVLENV